MLYCQLAPASSPITLIVPFELRPSPAVPVSSASARVGVTISVSTVRVTVLLASAPSLLVLPAASLKVPDATEITPLVVLFAVGVKVAL